MLPSVFGEAGTSCDNITNFNKIQSFRPPRGREKREPGNEVEFCDRKAVHIPLRYGLPFAALPV